MSAICALIREHGGFVALLNGIKSLFKSRKGGMLGMGLLVGAMDIATANNTVAIVMANPIASQMARTYDISRRKTASLLDTFSCVFQGVIPYGAQMLVAISAVAELGFSVSFPTREGLTPTANANDETCQMDAKVSNGRRLLPKGPASLLE